MWTCDLALSLGKYMSPLVNVPNMFACNSVSWHRILRNINSRVTVMLWLIIILLLLMFLMCCAMNKCKTDMIIHVKFALQITYDKGEKIKKEWGSWSQELRHKVANNGLETCPVCGNHEFRHGSWAVPVTLEGEDGVIRWEKQCQMHITAAWLRVSHCTS